MARRKNYHGEAYYVILELWSTVDIAIDQLSRVDLSTVTDRMKSADGDGYWGKPFDFDGMGLGEIGEAIDMLRQAWKKLEAVKQAVDDLGN